MISVHSATAATATIAPTRRDGGSRAAGSRRGDTLSAYSGTPRAVDGGHHGRHEGAASVHPPIRPALAQRRRRGVALSASVCDRRRDCAGQPYTKDSRRRWRRSADDKEISRTIAPPACLWPFLKRDMRVRRRAPGNPCSVLAPAPPHERSAVCPAAGAGLPAAFELASAGSLAAARLRLHGPPGCAAPAPEHAGCLALQLVPKTAEARAHTHPLGIAQRAAARGAPSPADGGFGLARRTCTAPTRCRPPPPATQTIALVDAYNDPSRIRPDSLRRRIRPARMHGGERLLQAGQPERRSRRPAVPHQHGESELRSNCERPEAHGKRPARKSKKQPAGRSRSRSTSRSPMPPARAATSCSSRPTRRATKTSKRQSARPPHSAPARSRTPGPVPRQASAGSGERQPLQPSRDRDRRRHRRQRLPELGRRRSERGSAGFPASSPHVVAVGGTRLTLGEHGELVG